MGAWTVLPLRGCASWVTPVVSDATHPFHPPDVWGSQHEDRVVRPTPRGGDVPDAALARIAAAQRGLVTRAQLLESGLGRGALAHRLERGRLHLVHRGVYLLGHPVPPPLAVELAATLACGRGAVVSHRSAATLWAILGPTTGPVDVTVPGRDCGRRRAGVRVHRARRLDRRDTTTKAGVPVTTPARTLLDLAEVVSDRELVRALGEAYVRGLVRRTTLGAVLDRSPGRRGAPRLRTLLAREDGPSLTRSEAEERMLALVGRARLPPPRVNARVAGYEVDLLWPRHRLVIEVDGFRFHSSRAAFERDRRRDAELGRAGYRVIRFTWRQLEEEPAYVVATLAAATTVGPQP